VYGMLVLLAATAIFAIVFVVMEADKPEAGACDPRRRKTSCGAPTSS